jgi:hypothetical protein
MNFLVGVADAFVIFLQAKGTGISLPSATTKKIQ